MHARFKDPFLLPPSDTVIWRYFDFAKFVSILDRREVFFPAADHLDDPFEGALPFAGSGCAKASDDSSPELRERRALVMISSWHANPDESFAMWKLYSRSVEAIAIRTTVGRLRSAFESESRYEVILGQVEYLDFDRDRLEGSRPPLAPFFCKPKPYSYENELRAVVDLSALPLSDRRVRSSFRDLGVYVQTDLSALIEEIYVSPSAGTWFLDLVRSILLKYRVDAKPRHSVLAASPTR